MKIDSRSQLRWLIMFATTAVLLLAMTLANRQTTAAPNYGGPPLPTATPTLCPNPFVDIEGNVFYTEIVALYCRGIVEGTDPTHYSPALNASREVAVKAVVLAFGIPAYTPTSPDFTDVPTSSAYFAYIEAAYHANLVQSYDAQTCADNGAAFPCFLPQRDISSAEMVSIIILAGGYVPPGTPTANTVRRDEMAGMLYNAIFGGPTPPPTETVTGTPPTATATFTTTDTPLPSDTPTATATPGDPTNTPSVTPTLCPNPFVDINGNIFYQAIMQLYCRGVVNGLDSTHFNPAGTSSRAQFAKVVVLGFNIPFYTPPGGTPDFTDVPSSYFAYAYIEAGYHANILSGYDAATCAAIGAAFPCFGPNRPITRAQLSKLVIVAAGYPPTTPSTPSFVDVQPNNVFYVFIETGYAKGIVSGYPGNFFYPDRNIRRDEMAQIVYKAITTP